MIHKRRMLAAIGSIAVLLIATACSSSSKSSTSAANAKSAPAAPIKVGFICGCSGDTGTVLQPSSLVYKAWVDSVNASGGLDGHQIQLTVLDDGSLPGTSATDAQKLIADHVDAIVDDTVNTATWASAVAAAHIPVVGANVSEPAMYTNPDFYSQGQTGDSSVNAVVAVAKSAGASNIAAFLCSNAAVCQELSGQIKTDGQQLGIPLVLSTDLDETAPNFTAQCLAAEQAHVKSIAIFDAGATIASIAASCAQQGYNPVDVIEGEDSNPTLFPAPGLKNDLWMEYAVQPFWSTAPEVLTMDAAVDKYDPGLRKSTTSWDEQAAQAWPAGLLLAAGVKAGGLTATSTPSPAEIIQGLDTLKGDTLGGWSPPLTFAAGVGHPVDCWFTAKVTNGTPGLKKRRKGDLLLGLIVN